ncbi:MAG: glycosyltransferase family 39 protein, partial [Myxococcales bacterium]|nr:glycosyltransferase family 39 protein [Myxococcales bacterium]
MTSPEGTRVRWPLRVSLLLLILGLGMWLRFTDLRALVPYMVDDAAYHLEGRYYVEVYEALRDTIALQIQERRTGEDLWKREAEFPKIRAAIEGGGMTGERIAPFYARPLHSALIAVALGVLGKDALYAGPAVSAVTGTLAILILYLLARRIHGDRAGLLAALLAAVSGYLVLYARNGFSEMNSVLFLILSMY